MPGVFDLIIHNARVCTLDDGVTPTAATVAIEGGRIAALDVADDAPARRQVNARGQVLLPGFIDCHTHAVFAGNRMDEHASRLEGASYQDIAKAGGGIMSTVRAVRDADELQLVAESMPRIRALLAEGVTTLEIKSGYGLDHEQELKMLRAIRTVGERVPATVVPTFLGAHTVPAGRERGEYMDELIERTLPAVAEQGLASMVDIYVEPIAFGTGDMERLFRAAERLGMRVKVHAEQLSHTGAAVLAAGHRALSADHLEWLDDAGAAAMAASGMVAVLLPGAWYCMRDERKPPVDALRAHGVAMAVATDLNPGTSPVASLLAVMHMAAHSFGLTPLEALHGVTRNAAAALGLEDRGTIEPGKRADLCLWDIPGPGFLLYRLGAVRPSRIFIEGTES
jgi:imidazolonepropionase